MKDVVVVFGRRWEFENEFCWGICVVLSARAESGVYFE